MAKPAPALSQVNTKKPTVTKSRTFREILKENKEMSTKHDHIKEGVKNTRYMGSSIPNAKGCKLKTKTPTLTDMEKVAITALGQFF